MLRLFFAVLVFTIGIWAAPPGPALPGKATPTSSTTLTTPSPTKSPTQAQRWSSMIQADFGEIKQLCSSFLGTRTITAPQKTQTVTQTSTFVTQNRLTSVLTSNIPSTTTLQDVQTLVETQVVDQTDVSSAISTSHTLFVSQSTSTLTSIVDVQQTVSTYTTNIVPSTVVVTSQSTLVETDVVGETDVSVTSSVVATSTTVVLATVQSTTTIVARRAKRTAGFKRRSASAAAQRQDLQEISKRDAITTFFNALAAAYPAFVATECSFVAKQGTVTSYPPDATVIKQAKQTSTQNVQITSTVYQTLLASTILHQLQSSTTQTTSTINTVTTQVVPQTDTSINVVRQTDLEYATDSIETTVDIYSTVPVTSMLVQFQSSTTRSTSTFNTVSTAFITQTKYVTSSTTTLSAATATTTLACTQFSYVCANHANFFIQCGYQYLFAQNAKTQTETLTGISYYACLQAASMYTTKPSEQGLQFNYYLSSQTCVLVINPSSVGVLANGDAINGGYEGSC